ncbi:MAG: sulfotransferase, partial [Parvularculaceae bacterium]
EALAAFLKAAAGAPNHPPILNTLGALMKERGDLGAARAYFEKAIASNARFIEAHYNLAATLASLGERAAARRSYENALAVNTNSAEALGRFAGFLEEEGDIDKARALAERALAANQRNFSAHHTLASLDVRAGDHQAVVARLGALAKAATLGAINGAILHAMLSRSLEKLGAYKESFEACSTANALNFAYFADIVARQKSPRSPENVARLIDYFERLELKDWIVHNGLAGAEPTFLVGFPRSGTTLLDQILSSHPRTEVLEEKENLADAWTDFILKDGGLDRLAGLTRVEINHYRAAYWRRVAAHARAADKLVIDKLPLDTALLGLIHRLFPKAKIIFAIRDPRDVVLSCFQQTFAMNAAMYQFLKLETTAAYYDQVMRLGALYRRKFPLTVHETRYERVVTDFTNEIAALLDFLELDWDDRVAAYDETARQRVVRTPSAKQVTEKLYASSIGKWRHYETQLRPVLPALEPWVRALGYAPSN